MYSDYIPTQRKETKTLLEKLDNPPVNIKTGRDLLGHIRVSKTLYSNNGVISASSQESICSVFAKIIDNHITSVPIYDNRTKHYLGFVDIIDIASYILNHASEREIKESPTNALNKIGSIRCDQIANLAQRNPYTAIGSEVTVDTAIELILKYSVHRLAIIDPDGSPVTLLTQSRLVQFLAENLDKFPKLCKKTVDDFKLGYKNVVSITQNQSIRSAVELMNTNSISGVPIVDSQNKIVGTFSHSNLKVLGHDFSKFNHLYDAVLDFMKLDGNSHTPHLVLPSTTIEQLLNIIVRTKVHRLFVIDNSGNTIGVIVLSTLLKLFLENTE